MNGKTHSKSLHRLWAEFRFSVVGGLLPRKLEKGELKDQLQELAEKQWIHPTSGKPYRIAFSTVEAWYYKAKNEKHDPIGKLRPKVRSDVGKSRKVSGSVSEVLGTQYAKYPYWNYQLHADNLLARIKKEPGLGEAPSYGAIRRYMQTSGMVRRKRPKNADRASAAATATTLAIREIRSYEAEYVGALWHLDYHHGSIKVVADNGEWVTPILLGFFDDYSRLCCHMQWYLRETAENLVHGTTQAFQKRGLPREILSDNGKPMVSDEFTTGLMDLSVIARTTLPYAPHMNAKAETGWNKVESRFIPMIAGYKNLTLKMLNDFTQAWVEMEYNRRIHRDSGERPIDRFARDRDVSRPCPPSEKLRMAFRMEARRKQRHSDGTISLEGKRYEIPSRLRCLNTLSLRYARWDLGFIHIVDERTGEPLARIYPIDKAENGNGQRRLIEDAPCVCPVVETTELPPLMQQCIDDYRAAGMMPAYIPKNENIVKDKEKSNACE